MAYKYRLSEVPDSPPVEKGERFKVGDVKVSNGVKYTVRSINPETGAVAWKVEYLPNFEELFNDVTDLVNTSKGVYTKAKTDDKLRLIYDEARLLRNKIRTHIRNEYPEEYRRITMKMNEMYSKGILDLDKDKVNEQQLEEFEVDDAVMELRNIVDDIEQKADEARDIVRNVFPSELSRLDGYGAFNAMYSTNRYDTTLGKFVDRLEEEGYEIEDGVAYVNEGHMMSMDDLDVGHQDDEPGMLKAELARAGKMIQMLYRAIDKYDDQGEVDFPQWWQKKIIQANSMLDSAFDYLDGQESVAKIDAIIDLNEEDIQKRKDAENAIRQTLKDEGGAAGLKPLVKAVKKFGFNKDELLKLLKKIVKVEKHKHGDYILTPINEEDDVEEISTSGAAGAYLTPYAFRLNKKALGTDDDTYVKQLGYKLAPNQVK